MKKIHHSISLLSVLFILIITISVSAANGWKNTGWSNIDWSGKACNSQTDVFDSPRYSKIDAFAQMNGGKVWNEKYYPAPNTYVHSWTVGGFGTTCGYGGNAYK